MLIDEDDMTNDVINFGTRFSIMFVYIRARFRFELIGRNLIFPYLSMAVSRAAPFMVISLLVWFSLTLHPSRRSLKACRARWYVSRVLHLQGEKQSKWWQAPWWYEV